MTDKPILSFADAVEITQPQEVVRKMLDDSVAALKATERHDLTYRGYRIHRNDFTAHPDWRQVQWLFTHEDYDGPEDNRSGFAESVEACMAEIDEREDD